MTDTTISDAVVFPQDDGTGSPSDDYDSAGYLGLIAKAVTGDGGYVDAGLDFNDVDTTNDAVDVSVGHAFIRENSYSVQSGAQETYDTTMPTVSAMFYTVILPSEVVDLGLASSSVNDIWLAVDPTAQDSVYIRHGSGLSAPSDPSVKLGTVDTSDGSTTRNRDGQRTNVRALEVGGDLFVTEGKHKNPLAIPGTAGANGTNSLALGSNSEASGARTIAIGEGATAPADDDLAFGRNSGDPNSGGNNVVFGKGTSTTAYNCVLIGKDIAISSNEAVCIGANSGVTGNNATAIGSDATAAGLAVAVGRRADAPNLRAVAIGQGTQVDINDAIAIGNGVSVSTQNVARIGERQLVFPAYTDTIADADLNNREMTVEMDEGAGAFRLRGKDSGGTIREATVAW